MTEIKHFFMDKERQLEDLGNGISRKVKAYSENLMTVEVNFETGAVGPVHTHPHEQCTYILEGVFEFEINGIKKIMKKGDTAYKESMCPHGAVCLEKGVLLDIFTPYRREFI